MRCPKGFRVFVDANLTALGRWLALRDEGFIHVGHKDWTLRPDSIDEEWLDFVGRCGWGVLMRDKAVRYRPRERAMLEKHRMTAIVIATRQNLSFEEQRRLVDEHWEAIDEVYKVGAPGIYHLTTGGVRLMEGF